MKDDYYMNMFKLIIKGRSDEYHIGEAFEIELEKEIYS